MTPLGGMLTLLACSLRSEASYNIPAVTYAVIVRTSANAVHTHAVFRGHAPRFAVLPVPRLVTRVAAALRSSYSRSTAVDRGVRRDRPRRVAEDHGNRPAAVQPRHTAVILRLTVTIFTWVGMCISYCMIVHFYM